MSDFIPFGSRAYAEFFLLLLFSRGVDFLSTWIATPNLVLEGNPVAKKLGWKWSILTNFALCFGLAFWPLPAVVISTSSVLLAARNFQSAWIMRSMGEQNYRDWRIQRIQETSATLFLFCLFGQTALTAGLGGAILYLADWQRGFFLGAIGLGIIVYSLAVVIYSMLAVWRLRRNSIVRAEIAQRNYALEKIALRQARNGSLVPEEQPQPQGK